MVGAGGCGWVRVAAGGRGCRVAVGWRERGGRLVRWDVGCAREEEVRPRGWRGGVHGLALGRRPRVSQWWCGR